MSDLANLFLTAAGVGLAALVMFKSVTHTVGDPVQESVPAFLEFFGDDNMTIMQGLHLDRNRMAPIYVKTINPSLVQVGVCGGIYEMDPSVLEPRPSFPTAAVADF